MADDTRIFVIDTSCSRRATVAHALGSYGLFAEPTDHLELSDLDAERRTLALICDDDGELDAFFTLAAGAAHPIAYAIYAEQPNLRRATRLVRDGACDYLAMPLAEDSVRDVIAMAGNAAAWSPSHGLRRIIGRKRLELLTDRERQVLVCVASGQSNREIAGALSISHRTVEVHRANMLRRLEASNTREATRIAIDGGLMGDPAEPIRDRQE
ncbi:MAG: response regulator transcription factor [Sphingomonadales bacterium]|nr:response regulator transcription factor [Sphingomonadales bacterium]